MSDIRFNNWYHQSGTGGVTQTGIGSVGIGTTVPEATLHVIGNIKADNFLGNIDVETFTADSINVTGIITASTIDATNINIGGDNASLSNRNMIINGAMVVDQRNVTATTSGSFPVDRFSLAHVTTGSVSVTSPAVTTPDVAGFTKSILYNVTAQDTGLAANEHAAILHKIEGYNLQQIRKGRGSEAKEVTLSFWARSNLSGAGNTFIVALNDNDNGRTISKTYTFDAADTWEKKVLTFSADTIGTFDNDNQLSLAVEWYLAAGSDYSGGTQLNTDWVYKGGTAVNTLNLSQQRPEDIHFSTDGTKMYIIIDDGGQEYILQYTLSTPWDLSTAGITSTRDISTDVERPNGIAVASDGLKLFVVDETATNIVNEYTMSNAHDMDTLTGITSSFSIETQVTVRPEAIRFSYDGTKMFILEEGGGSGHHVHQYSLSSSWSLTSPTYDGETADLTTWLSDPFGLEFSFDGTKMFISDVSANDVTTFSLSSAWDITSTVTFVRDYDVASESSTPHGVGFSTDGLNMYIVDNNFDQVYQYNFLSAYNTDDTGLSRRAVGQTNLLASTANDFYLTGVQLEVGNTATPFEHRSYGDELLRCQRYYYRIYFDSAQDIRIGTGQAISSSAGEYMVQFPVTMRTRPTALESSGTSSDYQVTTSTGSLIDSSIGGPTYQQAELKRAMVRVIVSSGLAAGNASILSLQNTGNGYLGWSAEL